MWALILPRIVDLAKAAGANLLEPNIDAISLAVVALLTLAWREGPPARRIPPRKIIDPKFGEPDQETEE